MSEAFSRFPAPVCRPHPENLPGQRINKNGLTKLLVALLLGTSAGGCASVGVQHQRLVSKPDMLFSDSPVYNYSNSKLQPQIENGRAASGGGQASGCTSCR